jgi:hypothetical protein
MKSEIQIKRTVIHSDYMLMTTRLINGKLSLYFADRHSEDFVRFHLSDEEIQILLRNCLLEQPNRITNLHAIFRDYPSLKRLLTEALLTFDTEAGGETMNLETATAEEEEQS